MFIWHLYVYCPSPFIVNELLPWPLLACTYSCTCRIIVFSFSPAVADSEILRGECNIQCIGPSVPSSFIANADSELDVLCVCYLPWCTVVLAETWIVGTNKLNLESFCMEKVTCWKFGKANRGRGQPLPAPHESTTALYSMWYCMHIFTYAILLYELSANYILWWRVDGIVFYFYYCSIVVFIHCKCSEVEYLYAISVAVPTTFS